MTVAAETEDAPPEKLPDVVGVLTDILGAVQKNPVGWVVSGLGYTVVVLVATIGLVVAMLAVVFGAAALDMPLVGMFGGLAVYLGGLLALILMSAPMSASMARNVDAHLEEDAPLSILAPFDRAGEDLPRVLGMFGLEVAFSMVGILLFYVGAIVAQLFLGFAMPGVLVDRLSPVEAIRRSVTHARDHLGWHAGFFGLSFAIMLVASVVPFIGIAVAMPVYWAYRMRMYRLVFGATSR